MPTGAGLCSANLFEAAQAFRSTNPKHAAADRQFADVFTKASMAAMLMLLKTLMDGTAAVPLLARLYQ